MIDCAQTTVLSTGTYTDMAEFQDKVGHTVIFKRIVEGDKVFVVGRVKVTLRHHPL
jgi:hypothetical protein